MRSKKIERSKQGQEKERKRPKRRKKAGGARNEGEATIANATGRLRSKMIKRRRRCLRFKGQELHSMA